MSKTVSPKKLSEDLSQKPDKWFLVDVRSPGEYRSGHIPGAENYPIDDFNAETAKELANSANGRQVCLICQSGKRSERALNIWGEAGQGSAVELEGGMSQWPSEAGLEKSGKAPLPLMRQVQIVAGSGVFIGTLLGAFVNPWFLIIPGFFGAGLTFAGLTGACGLAMVLTKMPWNR